MYRVRQRLSSLSLLAAALLPLTTSAARPNPDGKAIYQRQCIKCHGKAGEGVKGKYDDTLHGDWSVEKLSQYIDKNMPEDHPGRCKGPDATAVAQYIHQAFYSREARARNNPPRVELMRLTNRQYINTVADLLKAFGDPDSKVSGERGLKGDYNRRLPQNDGEKKSFQRVDRTLSFDFGTGSPFSAGKTNGTAVTNDFSIRWRGSVIADESGDYEFVLKTPNGTRLWVNNPGRPIIDAGVASGGISEHKATVRLIGGRAYPISVEFSKNAQEKAGAISLWWKPPHGALQTVPSRNLTPVNSSPTFVVSTAFPPDDSSVGYERGVSISKAWDEATTQTAIEVANHVVDQLDRLARTKASDTNRVSKVKAFTERFVSTAFRRPLNADQKRLFITLPMSNASTLEEGVKRVVLLTLKSPRFLYPGVSEGKADDFDIATRLALGLWDSLPDKELLQVAAQGGLRREETVRSQARRMLEDPRAHAKVRACLHHWLQIDRAEELTKDPALYPGFTPDIVADLRTSLNLFLDDVVWDGTSDYRRLLLEDDLWVNDRLARFYGVSAVAQDDFVRVNLDPKQRSGVITHPYLLAVFAYQKSSSPIHRGVFLTRNIIGRALRPPPMAVAFKDAEFSPNMTMREKVAELTRPQACQGCHSVINPLGFSLENYDAVGRFRTREADRLIDAVSDYATDDGKVVKLTGARDIAEFASNSQHAQDAFVELLFHQLVKQPLLAYGSKTPDRLRDTFVSSNYNIQKLIIDILAVSTLQGVPHSDRPTAQVSP